MINDSKHQAVAYDAQGNEVLVFTGGNSSYTDYLQFVRMDTGQAFPLFYQGNLGWNWNEQHDAPGLAHKGWDFCSSYETSASGAGWAYNQLFAFELNENHTATTAVPNKVWRLASAQNMPSSTDQYYNQPNVSVTNDGSYVYWGANWNNASGVVDTYRINLPSTWYTDMGGVLVGTPAPATLNAPTSLNVTLVGPTEASLNWVDTNKGKSSYAIQRSQSSSASFAQLTVVNPGITSFTDTALTMGSTYYYRVQASAGAQASAYSNVVQISPNPKVSSTYIGNVEIVQTGQMRVIGPAARKGIINPDLGDTAKIYFKGSSNGTYECSIFDLGGHLVFQESKTDLKMGMFEWAPKGMASGGYIVVIKGPGFNQTKKIAVIR
jgi:hypothetical protein